MTGWHHEKQAVANAARELAGIGLVTGSSGNVSARLQDHRGLLAITPLGKACSEVEARDIVVADFDAEPLEDGTMPSSETLLHAGIYRARPDVGAVIHTHPVYASVVAVAGLEVPPVIDEMVISIGGSIRVSKYAFPGTQELADSVLDALGDRGAALIRNHGAVAVGRDLGEAHDVSALVERVSQVYVQASILGKVVPLPEQVVETEMALYRMKRRALEERD